MPHDPSTDFYVEEETVENEFDAEDFAFVLSADGALKSVMIPEHLMDDPPEEVILILNLFGIDNIHTLSSRTLH